MKTNPASCSTDKDLFTNAVRELARSWRENGVPPRRQLREQLRDLQESRRQLGIASLRETSAAIVTATIDDGWGHGIETVALCARALGLAVHELGLEVRPGEIAAACHALQPRYLALTVLHMESEAKLRQVVRNMPARTDVIVGGAFVQNVPDALERLGIIPARRLLDFLELLLEPRIPAVGPNNTSSTGRV